MQLLCKKYVELRRQQHKKVCTQSCWIRNERSQQNFTLQRGRQPALQIQRDCHWCIIYWLDSSTFSYWDAMLNFLATLQIESFLPCRKLVFWLWRNCITSSNHFWVAAVFELDFDQPDALVTLAIMFDVRLLRQTLAFSEWLIIQWWRRLKITPYYSPNVTLNFWGDSAPWA
jgi:hypothetical protein